MATIKDISREAGVSTGVVSVVLNGCSSSTIRVSPATAKRIADIAKRMDYRPNLVARRLIGKKSGIIGVVMDSCAPYSYRVRLSLIERYASIKGYRLMTGQAHDDVEKIKDYARFFADNGIDGAICMAHGYPMENGQSDGIPEFFLSKIKTVFMQRPYGIDGCCSVSVDVERNFQDAVGHLASIGRRRIGFFKISDFAATPTMSMAQRAYASALEAAGLAFDPALVKGVSYDDKTRHEKAMPSVRELLASGCDAIVAVDDFVAGSVLKCLLQIGVRVPDDLALTGCDNIEFAGILSPGLTSFDQHNDDVAVKLVDSLTDLIEERRIPPGGRHTVIQPTMVRRESA